MARPPVRFQTPLHEEICCRWPRPFSRPLSRPPARSTRQSQGPLRLRRPTADRRHRSHLGVRLRARLGHSRQGKGAHADFRVLVRPHALDRPQSRAVDRSGDYPEPAARGGRLAARPFDARQADRAAADRMRRARLPLGLRLEGLRRHRRGLRHPAAARTARVGPAARAHLYAGHQGRRRGHDINISEAQAAELVGRRGARSRPRTDAAAVRRRRGPRRVTRHHRRRHEVRVRAAARDDGRPAARIG